MTRKAHEAAIPIRERLAREPSGGSPETPANFGGTLHSLALIDLGARRFDEARDRLQQAIIWQKKALAVNPRNPKYRQFMTGHLNGMIATACEPWAWGMKRLT